MFHGSEDTVVIPKQSELMFEALKTSGGNVRLWELKGVRHNAWDKGYAEPELPKWLLAHKLAEIAVTQLSAERLVIPVHPFQPRSARLFTTLTWVNTATESRSC